MIAPAASTGAPSAGPSPDPPQQVRQLQRRVVELEQALAARDRELARSRSEIDHLHRELDERDHRIRGLQERLAGRQESSAWRRRLEQVPTRHLTPGEKLVAADLFATFRGRAKHGNEEKPLFIEGRAHRVGISAESYGATITKMDAAGLLKRTARRDQAGHLRVYVQPTESFWRPETFQRPEGQERRYGQRPVCPTCGPEAPVLQRTTTRTQHICRSCGEILTDETAVADRELPPLEPPPRNIRGGSRADAAAPAACPAPPADSAPHPESVGIHQVVHSEGVEPHPEIFEVAPAGLDTIPPELRARRQWAPFRFEERRGEPTKVPINPRTGGRAKANDPSTWGTLDEAVAAQGRFRLHGLGYFFSEDDPFTGFDIDKCRDPATGTIATAPLHALRALSSYSEVSPLGTGVHVIMKATKPGLRCKTTLGGYKVEMYDRGRYFTMTGRHLVDFPATIEPRQAQLDRLYASLFPPEPPPSPRRGGNGHMESRSDAEVLEKARRAKNGAKFWHLWRGDWKGYASQSEADLALCRILAFWCAGDTVQTDRLFRESGLMRQKWDDRHHGNGETCGERTICVALGGGP